ncbi:acyltransferase family protein [Novosphingobium gossypii]|uniref:acyltransferase family protein n=1 Tax=Novosphingobium gossypii TaxID=1604774 RepID=UPI003D25C61A
MLLNIQVLRATAAMLVVLVHLQTLGSPLGLEPLVFDLFAVGVDLFFVISGFIMVHTTSRRPVSPGRFIVDRLVRIAPLYWGLTVAVFVVALAVPHLLGTTRADWGALARSLAFIPAERGDGTMRPILFVGWSLNLEMAFYVIFALALMIRERNRRIGGTIGLLLVVVAFGALMRDSLSPEVRFLTQPMLLEFAAGMAIGWLYPRLPASKGAAILAACLAPLALVMLVWMARWPLPGGWPGSLPAAVAAVICALVAERGGLAIAWRPAQSIGDASYALYLTHPFVTQAWTQAALHAGFLSPTTAPWLLAGAMACAVIVALGTHAWIEQPLGRAARRFMGTVQGTRFRTGKATQVGSQV